VTGPLADALELLTRWSAPDRDQELLRRSYLDHLRRNADGLLRSCRPDHLTASTLVLSEDGEAVLLTLHRKAGRWFQLGGHVEAADRTLAGAALREAVEESGRAELRLDPDPVHLDTHDVPFCGAGTRHLDVRFVAVAAGGRDHVTGTESLALRWWPAEELPTQEPSLRRLVDLGRERLGVLRRT